MVSFVVENHDRTAPVQISQDAAGEGVRALRPLVDYGVTLAALSECSDSGAKLVPVGYQNSAALEEWPELSGNEVELFIVVGWIVGAQDLEALLDGQVRTDRERGGREAFVAGKLAPVAEGPGYEHSHDDGLAGPGSHLAAEPRERR